MLGRPCRMALGPLGALIGTSGVDDTERTVSLACPLELPGISTVPWAEPSWGVDVAW